LKTLAKLPRSISQHLELHLNSYGTLVSSTRKVIQRNTMDTSKLPKTGFEGLKAHFKSDLSSGFSVSLIALPLCLGIAIASGVPPLAGLITAIVGGLIGSRISGSYVTISGPAAGLIVVILGAAEGLGGAGAESDFAGYPHTLGAVLIAGAIMALFGLLKVGKVGDFFPSAAVHGMLAAIGVIIMIKQFFPAIGVQPGKASILSTAAQIPGALLHTNSYSAIIAIATILILIVHPKINWTPVKVVPAPMWVMIVTIGLAMNFGSDKLALVEMPKDLFGSNGFTLPSFSKIGEGAFWSAVIAIALVAAIESLLSAKAVDALDPYQRKSNLDKDLLAMGTSSSIAAIIGGLPMISEIVRSSANINNGGKTQWANFFHGAFLLVFLLLFTPIIELIPISALAAMLVFTGFRLASPKEFLSMWQIGKIEFAVFTCTLLTVLATDLIVGIAAGIVVNYLLLLVSGARIGNTFKVKAFENVGEKANEIHLSGDLLFTNFLSLKKHMDSALTTAQNLVLEFSEVTFIDHTTMTHLENLRSNSLNRGVVITFVALEGLEKASSHVLSQRLKVSHQKLPKNDTDAE